MLGELGIVPLSNELSRLRLPLCFIEIANLPPQLFRLCRCGRCQNLGQHFIIAKQPGFTSHHPMFGGRVTDVIDGESEWIPLTHTRRYNGSIGWNAMPPKKNVRE